MDEARKIADFIGVPIEEVIRHSGIEIRSSEGAATGGIRSIPIVAEVDGDGRISPLERETSVADYMRDGVFDQVKDTPGTNFIGAIVKAPEGALSFIDDALILFSPDQALDDRSVGALAIVEPRGGGGKLLARIMRARKSGMMSVRHASGEDEEIDVVVATPIEIIFP